ncbi:hypothetical protein LCGC14_1686120 [marine sediment metagenome]|uniref:Uncharacterized protein n=1 Tax=marine sediment metagenome TaxID=412755 RepID=A0A0F9HMJ8_9ZZZZ
MDKKTIKELRGELATCTQHDALLVRKKRLEEMLDAAERLAEVEAKCEGLEEHNIELQKQCSSLADQLAAFTSDSNIGKQYGEPCDQGDKEAPPCANSPSSPEPGAEGKTE